MNYESCCVVIQGLVSHAYIFTGEWVYCAGQEIEPNPTKIVNTVHFMEPRGDYVNNGNANMATAYALMLYLAHNEFEAARPIMKWLHTQHNDIMAWSSTQVQQYIKIISYCCFVILSLQKIHSMHCAKCATSTPWQVKLNIAESSSISILAKCLVR